MQSKKMDWLERDTEFKYDGITTYFCIFSLFILFVIFSSAILITGYHYTEDLLVLFAGFIFFIFLYFYMGVYIITLLQERNLIKEVPVPVTQKIKQKQKYKLYILQHTMLSKAPIKAP